MASPRQLTMKERNISVSVIFSEKWPKKSQILPDLYDMKQNQKFPEAEENQESKRLISFRYSQFCEKTTRFAYFLDKLTNMAV